MLTKVEKRKNHCLSQNVLNCHLQPQKYQFLIRKSYLSNSHLQKMLYSYSQKCPFLIRKKNVEFSFAKNVEFLATSSLNATFSNIFSSVESIKSKANPAYNPRKLAWRVSRDGKLQFYNN